MARRDLSNAEIEEMGRVDPGSAAEYLRLMREELAEEKQARREEEDKELFVEQFVAAGGNRADALAERKKRMNERALDAARRADEAALHTTQRHITRSL
jgi:hypothetical protein